MDPKLARGIAFGLLLVAPFWITVAYFGLFLWTLAACLVIVGVVTEVTLRDRNEP